MNSLVLLLFSIILYKYVMTENLNSMVNGSSTMLLSNSTVFHYEEIKNFVIFG